MAALVLAAAACGSTHRPASAPGSTAPSGVARTDAAGTVWLCRPGIAGDPCAGRLGASALAADGSRTVVKGGAATSSRFDCFYVYPTISGEPGPNSDLRVQDSETGIARLQASRFSQVCDVWAPMYRQVTLRALVNGGLPALDTAYRSLLGTWNDYLRNFNHGRPVVFIGHSQGAAMLIRLIANQVDPAPTIRARVLMAIIAGGNVQVAAGQPTGGSFRYMPLCSSTGQTGCVIAYSTFPSEPPPAAFFGRPGQGVSLMSLQLRKAGQQVACVNPSALSGGQGVLEPYFPVPPSAANGGTTWVTYPGLYTASCHNADGASWLQVDHVATPGDNRPVISAWLGPAWGYHGDDVNVALGNLVDDVRAAEAHYGH